MITIAAVVVQRQLDSRQHKAATAELYLQFPYSAFRKTLADGGVMLYATCSVLKDENEHQLNDFLQTHANARLLDTPIQIFPGDSAMDGFFYAAIKKSAS